ncbi:MAG: hypothetical protein AAFY59_12890 [Pseudomonadota bacterium]
MPSILDYAEHCEAVYSDNPAVVGWARAHFRASLNSGLQAAVFTRGQETVVAFKGTTFTDPNDVIADAKLGLGMNSTYFWEAEAFVKRYATQGNVSVTGHSLGGAIAQIVGHRRRLPFVTFNAPGVALFASKGVFKSNPILTAGRAVGTLVSAFRHPIQAKRDLCALGNTNNGINYRLWGDAVSMMGVHYGPVSTLQAPGVSANPGSRHLIGNVINVLGNAAEGQMAFP